MPALVYAAGQTPRHATTASLVLVAVTAIIGMAPIGAPGASASAPASSSVHAGIGCSLLGSHWNEAANSDALLLAFSGLMLVAA